MSDDVDLLFGALQGDLMESPMPEPVEVRRAAQRRSRRRASVVFGAVAVVAAGAAFLASTPAQPAPPAATATPTDNGVLATCRTAQLSLGEYGVDPLAAGNVVVLGLTNRGSTHCRLSEYPQLTFVDSAGRALPTTEVRQHTAAAVALGPGDTIYFTVTTYLTGAEAEGAPCDPPAAALWAVPSGDSLPLVLAGPWRACGHGRIEVGLFLNHSDPAWHP